MEIEDDGSPDPEGADGEQDVAHVANIVGHKRSDIRFWVRIRSEEPHNAYSEGSSNGSYIFPPCG